MNYCTGHLLVELLEHQENLIIGVLFVEEGKSLRNGLVKAVEPIETVGVGAVGLQVRNALEVGRELPAVDEGLDDLVEVVLDHLEDGGVLGNHLHVVGGEQVEGEDVLDGVENAAVLVLHIVVAQVEIEQLG